MVFAVEGDGPKHGGDQARLQPQHVRVRVRHLEPPWCRPAHWTREAIEGWRLQEPREDADRAEFVLAR